VWQQELQSSALGNPHSAGAVASKTAELVETARALTFDFFGASPQEYDVVFTSGATAAVRTVGEYFPWAEDRYLTASCCIKLQGSGFA
jgi:molybdenum cofactor sulfurtransferase